ncbi:transporter substrate-binding domain-containing protein [Zooshikella marina]|uniref:substrate-binding periplasmic protein n=1 Tax=Zooshikella ganghwensis TaxID=202772 RepID=UPI000408E11F|nr:transporter substrate-binding domain-containing protein [Zooshikella ganghwensis]MBU2705388.1 transporter substrate-binding domain-containing protein [Zooshikella ganghwensis]
MIRLFSVSLIFIFLNAFCEETESVTDTTKTVSITSGEWPPYTSHDLEGGGVFTKIITQAFSLEGYSVDIKYYPWQRSYFLTADGQADASLAWAPTDDRKKDFIFSDPVTFSTKVFFHLKAFKFNWNSLNDVRHLRTIATKKYTYGNEFDLAAKQNQMNIIYSNNDEQKFRMLLAGRADLVPMEKLVGLFLIKNKFTVRQASRITYHNKPLQNTPICVAFSKKINSERLTTLLQAFNEGLAKLKESGQYDKILEDL